MPGISFSEGSGVNDSVFGKSLEPIQMFLEARAEAFEQMSLLNKIFKFENSTHWAEKLTGMTGMKGFQPVGENGDYPTDGMQEGFSKVLENVTWKDSFSISKEMIDDNQTLELQNRPAAFMNGYYRSRQLYGAALFGSAIKGETSMTFGGKSFVTSCNDGLAMFSKVHPSKVDANYKQSNLYAGDLTAENLGKLETHMQNVCGDVEEVLGLAPDTIIIPNDAELKNKAFTVTGSTNNPETGNGYNYQVGRWNILVWPYLNQFLASGVKPWILMDSNYNQLNRSAVWLDREPLNVRSELAGNDANVWKGRARYVNGFNDWRGFFAGGITGGTAM